MPLFADWRKLNSIRVIWRYLMVKIQVQDTWLYAMLICGKIWILWMLTSQIQNSFQFCVWSAAQAQLSTGPKLVHRGTTTKQIGMIKCIILPLNLLNVFRVVWNDWMCIFLGSTASCATDNMQFMKYDFARLVATLREVAVDQCVGKRLYRLRRFAVGRQWLMPFWNLYR